MASKTFVDNHNNKIINTNLIQKPSQIKASQQSLNSGSPLLIPSSQLLSSMPSLVAAAVAGISTLIPLNSQLPNQRDTIDANEITNGTNMNISNNEMNTAVIPQATSSASPGTSTTIIQSTETNPNKGFLTANSNMNNNADLLDLVQCKMISPYHVMNDPRLLECGSSACFQCIISKKDADSNLKCPYCSNVHNIPLDRNKIIMNKNLQSFLKSNLRQINQIDDSMNTLEQKIQDQNLTMENFDQYLTLVQKDVQMKVETMKNHLEKYGEQFIENLKIIRKEVQKQWADHKSLYRTLDENNKNNVPKKVNTINNVLLQQHQRQKLYNQQFLLQQQQQIEHETKDKNIQFIGLKQEPLIQLNNSNSNVIALLNNNSVITDASFHLNSINPIVLDDQNNNNQCSQNGNTLISTQNINQQFNDKMIQKSNGQSVNMSNNERNNMMNFSILNSNKQTSIQHTDNLNGSLEGLQNFYNSSNNTTWNTTEEDLGDIETDIALKPNQPSQGNQKRHLNKEQAQFNKFVREEVSKKFGEDFLIQNEVNQLESSAMEIIRNEAISSYLPKETTPARAWTLAKVSLRSLKRDLRRKQVITMKKRNKLPDMIQQNSNYDVQ